MTTPLLALKGTWEEIVAQIPDFSGQKLCVSLCILQQNIALKGTIPVPLPRCWQRLPRPSLLESLPSYRQDSPTNWTTYLRHPQTMTQVFADTLYWVASITPGDPWYAPRVASGRSSGTCGSLSRSRRCWWNSSRPTPGAARICVKKRSRPSEPSRAMCMSPCCRRHTSHYPLFDLFAKAIAAQPIFQKPALSMKEIAAQENLANEILDGILREEK